VTEKKIQRRRLGVLQALERLS